MRSGRSRFAGGDQAYLKDEQYREPSRLAARTNLHLKYGTATTPWFDWVHRTAAIPSRSTVLEVGCGEGRLWELAPPTLSGIRLTLVDLSAGMVRAATKRGRSSAHPVSPAGTVADVQCLPFPDRSFDVVVANHMLYHAPDPPSGVAELARVLRAEGLLIAATNGARHLAEFGDIRSQVFGIPPLDDTVRAFGIETGTPMLRAEFDDVRWVPYEDHLRCTHPADVIAYLRSVPPGEGASVAQVARMEAAVLEQFRRGGGTMVVSKESGVFLATKPRSKDP